jgi:SpoVK/Ycf46/Vps4 family AAA+-type ATPase
MQGVFLSEWDGLTQDNKDLPECGEKSPKPTLSMGSMGAPVVLLGATNRPQDLDKAFLRRMPVQIMTPMPGTKTLLLFYYYYIIIIIFIIIFIFIFLI